jgi:hypothetical protein
MSDYEIVSLFNDLLNTGFARLNDFMVGLFAVLVTAYMAARDLTRPMVGLVLALYTMFSIVTIVPTLVTFNRFALAADLVREAAKRPDSPLSGLFAILPAAALVTSVMAVLLVGAYAGGWRSSSRPDGAAIDAVFRWTILKPAGRAPSQGDYRDDPNSGNFTK